MKKFFLGMALISMAQVALAQQVKVSVKAGGNYSSIGSVTYQGQLSVPVPAPTGYYYSSRKATIKEEFTGNLGGYAGVAISASLNEGVFFESGLQVEVVRFEKKKKITDWDIYSPGSSTTPFPTTPGVPIGDVIFNDVNVPNMTPRISLTPEDGKTNLVYITVPLLAGMSFLEQRLQLKAGFTPAALVYSEQYRSRFTLTAPSSSSTVGAFESYKDKSKEGLRKLLIGSTVEASFLFTRRIGLSANYSHQWSSIYSAENSSARNNLFSLGMRYSLN